MGEVYQGFTKPFESVVALQMHLFQVPSSHSEHGGNRPFVVVLALYTIDRYVEGIECLYSMSTGEPLRQLRKKSDC